MTAPTLAAYGGTLTWSPRPDTRPPLGTCALVTIAHPVHGWCGITVDCADGQALLHELANLKRTDPARSTLGLLAAIAPTHRDAGITPATVTPSTLAASWRVHDDHSTLTLLRRTVRRDGTRAERVSVRASYLLPGFARRVPIAETAPVSTTPDVSLIARGVDR